MKERDDYWKLDTLNADVEKSLREMGFNGSRSGSASALGSDEAWRYCYCVGAVWKFLVSYGAGKTGVEDNLIYGSVCRDMFTDLYVPLQEFEATLTSKGKFTKDHENFNALVKMLGNGSYDQDRSRHDLFEQTERGVVDVDVEEEGV